MKKRIRIEDQGQDFLWFVVDENDKIVDAGPFQAAFWSGNYIPGDMLRVGELCPIYMPRFIYYGYLIYKVESIEEMT